MILLDHAPYAPFMDPRTARAPGLCPLEPIDWTVVHDDFAAQMAYREELVVRERAAVIDALPGSEAGVAELFDVLLAHLAAKPGYAVEADAVIRPDGVTVAVDRADPLATMGRLAAEDFCLMEPDAASGEYRLTAAVLCFPSRWLLSEKIGRPLTIIHDPVPYYDDALARRVNRVFEALRPGRGLVRCNWLVHTNLELFQPMGRDGPRAPRSDGSGGPLYLRTERQSLVRLPETGAVVFAIKTSTTPVAQLDAETLSGMVTAFEERLGEETADGDSMADKRRTLERLRELA